MRDFRYENIEIINRYHGVFRKTHQERRYMRHAFTGKATFIVGRYESETNAAVAHNKAAAVLIRKGYDKKYPVNYVEELSPKSIKPSGKAEDFQRRSPI